MNTLSAHQLFLMNRVSQDEMYMGHSLMRFVVKNNWQISDLQRELSCDSSSLMKLVLCRNLSFGEPNFQQDVEQISEYTTIDAAKIAILLKRISMLSTFSQVQRNSSPSSYSFLAAAREKETKSDTSPSHDE